jgi:hypothetical protein
LKYKKLNPLFTIKYHWLERKAIKIGDKDYTKSEKQLLISLIDDYSLFGGHEHDVI